MPPAKYTLKWYRVPSGLHLLMFLHTGRAITRGAPAPAKSASVGRITSNKKGQVRWFFHNVKSTNGKIVFAPPLM